MTNSKRTASLDQVLADYALASQDFDAKVLQAFVDKYPEHARALQRYAQVQLTSVPASAEDAENEQLSDDVMLPMQSKLLQRMQELRGNPSASDLAEAAKKLADISGDKATQAATIAVFGSCEHGEDLLLLCVTDSPSEVERVPGWFYDRLGSHIGLTAAVVRAGIAMRRQASGLQRFSSKQKPKEQPQITWEQAIEDCITDGAVKRTIFKRSSHA